MYNEHYHPGKTYRNGIFVEKKQFDEVVDIFINYNFFGKHKISIFQCFFPYLSDTKFLENEEFVKQFDFKGYSFVITSRTFSTTKMVRKVLTPGRSYKMRYMYFEPIVKQ